MNRHIMNGFTKSSIGQKLFYSYSLLILLFFLFGLYALYDIHKTSNLIRIIYNHPLVVSNAAIQSTVSITKMHRDMKDIVLFNDPKRVKASIDKVVNEQQQVYKNLNIVRNKILGDEGKNLEQETRILFEKWLPIREEVIALIRNGKRQEAAEITIGKGATHVAQLEARMKGLTDYAKSKALIFFEKAEKTNTRAVFVIVIFFVSFLVIALLVAFWSIRQSMSAEKKILSAFQLNENIIAFSPVGILIYNTAGDCINANDTAAELLGGIKDHLLQ